MYLRNVSDEWQDQHAIGREIDQLRAMAEILLDAGKADEAASCRMEAACLELEYDAPFTLEIIY